MNTEKRFLVPVSKITIPSITQFIATENFVVDVSNNARVKISHLGEAFLKNFLPKVEGYKVVAEDLIINKLLECSFDPAIITALGGEAKVEITLGQYFAAFAKQPNGEDGPLLKDGQNNVGYIRDINSILCAIRGRWLVDGWDFGASPLGSPNVWLGGRHFISR